MAAYSTYTGAWSRGVETYTDQGDVQHTADPGHETYTVPSGAAANFMETPPADNVEQFVDPVSLSNVVGSDWMYVDTPTHVPEIQDDGHQGNGAHDVSDGATSFIYNRPTVLQFSDEQYVVDRWETPALAPSGPDGSVDGFVKANFRGLNSLSENNPEGFRNGYDSNPFVQRHFNVGERTHLHRPLAPNVIFDPTVIPANTQSPYGRVFASNTKWQSVEVPTSYTPVTPPANFDSGVVQQGDATYSPVVGW